MKRILLYSLLFCALAIIGQTKISPPKFYSIEIKEVDKLQVDQISQVNISFSQLDSLCGDIVPVKVIGLEDLNLVGETNFTADLSEDSIFSINIQVIIPSNQISTLKISLGCRHFEKEFAWYFISKKDEIRISESRPHEEIKSNSSRPIRDTLTAEQLDVKYEAAFDLRKKEHYDFIKQYVDSLIPQSREGIYHGFVSLKTIYQIGDNYPFDEKIEMDWVDVPWRQNKQQNEKKK